MKKAILFLMVLSAHLAFSQAEEVKNYQWDANPKFREIPKEFLDYPAVVLKDYRLYDNRVGEYTYKSYVVKHCAIKILSDKEINDYNKVSIKKKYVRDYRDLKARVIKADGRIELLPQEKIIVKEDSDEKHFVFEGVEKGDIIEYYYVIKDFPDFSGVEYFQRLIPVMDAKFQINKYVSQGKTFAFGYNGMKNVSVGSQAIFAVSDLPAYKSETNATNYANLAKVYYFSDTREYDYDAFYNDLNSYADGTSAKSMIKKFVEELKLKDTTVTLDERLNKMDIYLKQNVELGSQYNYKKIFEDKKITPKMVLNFYKDVLDCMDVTYTFLVSTDKFEDYLDKQEAVPQMLSEIMIYVPETKKCLSPFYYWMPYGNPIPVTVNNEAVSMHKYEGRPAHSFVKVDNVSMNENIVNTDSEITIDDDMETVSVNKKMELTGYRSYYGRYNMKYIAEDKIKDYVKNNVFQGIDVDLKKYNIENKEYELNYDKSKPFTFDTQVQIKEAWLENAGKNYLFSIGKVIGKQNDLYQEKERKYPIVLNYPKKYKHVIKINVPQGYAVKDVSNLIFSKQIKNDKNEVIGLFSSVAEINGNVVKVTAEEFYNFSYLEKEKYNEYRDLVNAAFDFYKSSLLLSKV